MAALEPTGWLSTTLKLSRSIETDRDSGPKMANLTPKPCRRCGEAVSVAPYEATAGQIAAFGDGLPGYVFRCPRCWLDFPLWDYQQPYSLDRATRRWNSYSSANASSAAIKRAGLSSWANPQKAARRAISRHNPLVKVRYLVRDRSGRMLHGTDFRLSAWWVWCRRRKQGATAHDLRSWIEDSNSWLRCGDLPLQQRCRLTQRLAERDRLNHEH